jgi:transposase-like protein
LFGTLVEVADWFPEQEEHHMLARFGATDTPTCPYCKNPMRLTKRKPHPKHGYEFELQTFTCGVCQHEIEGDADILGEVLA